MLVGLGLGDVAGIIEDLTVVEVEEGIQSGGPVLHGHGDLPAGPGLGQIEEGADQTTEVVEFVADEVVLADGDVAAQDLALGAARPGGQAHVGLVGSSARGDELGGGVAVDGVMELVLDGGEEALGGRGVLVVVDAGGVDVGDLLVETALGQADLANLVEQALEVVLAEEGSVLHTLAVDDVAADSEVAQHAGGPLAELGGAYRVDAVAHRDDRVEVIVGNPPVDLPLSPGERVRNPYTLPTPPARQSRRCCAGGGQRWPEWCRTARPSGARSARWSHPRNAPHCSLRSPGREDEKLSRRVANQTTRESIG